MTFLFWVNEGLDEFCVKITLDLKKKIDLNPFFKLLFNLIILMLIGIEK